MENIENIPQDPVPEQEPQMASDFVDSSYAMEEPQEIACEEHIPEDDDGDCTTAIKCNSCDVTTTEANDRILRRCLLVGKEQW